MDFLEDYWTFHKRYEVSKNYALFSAVALLGAVLHRKVHFLHGDIEIHGNLYVLLVGPQGNGKSTCCDFAQNLFVEVCPDYEVGASTQSAEDIVTEMSKDKFARSFQNAQGECIEVRPYAFFINEFKDFIAYAPTRMLNFLGNIYDRKMFKAGTIKRGIENIINPSLNILGCENPDQLSGMMKNSILTGGMSRRIIMVYETDYAPPRAIIEKTPESETAWSRVKDRVREARKLTGEFKWHSSGEKFYVPWYESKQKSLSHITNNIIQGYISTKHIQLFKICMGLDAVSDKPMFLLTDELLQRGLALLDPIETNMPKLSIAAGRNETIVAQHRMLDIIAASGGWIPEKKLRKEIEGELRSFEIDSVLKHLEDTDQAYKKLLRFPVSENQTAEMWVICTPQKYAWLVKEQGTKS